MKTLQKMSDTDITRWLDKTANSLVSYAAKGGYPNAGRGQSLRDRFNELKQEAIYRGIWKKWCDSRSYSHEADDFSFFA